MDWAKATARRDEKHYIWWFGASYIKVMTAIPFSPHSLLPSTAYPLSWVPILIQPWTCLKREFGRDYIDSTGSLLFSQMLIRNHLNSEGTLKRMQRRTPLKKTVLSNRLIQRWRHFIALICLYLIMTGISDPAPTTKTPKHFCWHTFYSGSTNNEIIHTMLRCGYQYNYQCVVIAL